MYYLLVTFHNQAKKKKRKSKYTNFFLKSKDYCVKLLSACDLVHVVRSSAYPGVYLKQFGNFKRNKNKK